MARSKSPKFEDETADDIREDDGAVVTTTPPDDATDAETPPRVEMVTITLPVFIGGGRDPETGNMALPDGRQECVSDHIEVGDLSGEEAEAFYRVFKACLIQHVQQPNGRHVDTRPQVLRHLLREVSAAIDKVGSGQ